MSKSYNNFHPTAHKKNNRYPRYILGIDKNGNLKGRNRKIKPYGFKGWCGYGGEQYLKKYGEIMTDVVNKKYERIKGKKQIEYELFLYETEWDFLVNLFFKKQKNE